MKNVDAYLIGVISTGILILVNSILLKFINLTFTEYSSIIYFIVSLFVGVPTIVCIVTYIHSKGHHHG